MTRHLSVIQWLYTNLELFYANGSFDKDVHSQRNTIVDEIYYYNVDDLFNCSNVMYLCKYHSRLRYALAVFAFACDCRR